MIHNFLFQFGAIVFHVSKKAGIRPRIHFGSSLILAAHPGPPPVFGTSGDKFFIVKYLFLHQTEQQKVADRTKLVSILREYQRAVLVCRSRTFAWWK